MWYVVAFMGGFAVSLWLVVLDLEARARRRKTYRRLLAAGEKLRRAREGWDG